MATPRIDRMASELIKRIPTEFKSAFTPGTMAMPDSDVLTKEEIINYLNQAMDRVFNKYWAQSSGVVKIFARLFPELIFPSEEEITDVEYNIADPHLDLKKVISALGFDNNEFIKVWDESRFAIAQSGQYDEELEISDEKPVLIQMNRTLYLFPVDIASFSYKIQYIKLPRNPETGDYLTQNGSYDSPFSEEWEGEIIDTAYQIYLIEAQETL